MSFFERQREKIAFAGPNDCWLWKAGKYRRGYGMAYERGSTRQAHREAYQSVHGFGSADGLLVMHKCDVPACVNPKHLRLGTPADNMADKVAKGRQSKPRGEQNPNAKLTNDDVMAIRKTYAPRDRNSGGDALAEAYGVSASVISNIIHRRTWTHI